MLQIPLNFSKKNYSPIFRRRREGKTDYRKRKGIVIGRSDFVTAAISGRYILTQLHKASLNGDVTLCQSSSKELSALAGWNGSFKSLPAAYLTGYLLGKRSVAKGYDSACFYSGVGRFVQGSRIASLLAGANDAGLKIAVGEEILPDETRIKGEHIERFSKELQEKDPNLFRKRFSQVIASGFDPTNYHKHFEEAKSRIEKIDFSSQS